MALKRNVGLQSIRYRGGGPMLASILHRITGLAMVLFVGTHMVASFAMQQFGSNLATSINIIYESVYFQFLMIFVVFYHMLNGFRIIVLDLWPKLLEFQREAIWIQWLIFIPVYGLVAWIMFLALIKGS